MVPATIASTGTLLCSSSPAALSGAMIEIDILEQLELEGANQLVQLHGSAHRVDEVIQLTQLLQMHAGQLVVAPPAVPQQLVLRFFDVSKLSCSKKALRRRRNKISKIIFGIGHSSIILRSSGVSSNTEMTRCSSELNEDCVAILNISTKFCFFSKSLMIALTI